MGSPPLLCGPAACDGPDGADSGRTLPTAERRLVTARSDPEGGGDVGTHIASARSVGAVCSSVSAPLCAVPGTQEPCLAQQALVPLVAGLEVALLQKPGPGVLKLSLPRLVTISSVETTGRDRQQKSNNPYFPCRSCSGPWALTHFAELLLQQFLT